MGLCQLTELGLAEASEESPVEHEDRGRAVLEQIGKRHRLPVRRWQGEGGRPLLDGDPLVGVGTAAGEQGRGGQKRDQRSPSAPGEGAGHAPDPCASFSTRRRSTTISVSHCVRCLSDIGHRGLYDVSTHDHLDSLLCDESSRPLPLNRMYRTRPIHSRHYRSLSLRRLRHSSPTPLW